MDFSHLSLQQWIFAGLAALLVGLAKSGFGGLGMLIVILMASVMPGYERESTGVVLPLLICGDLLASGAFRRHVKWGLLGRMLLPTAIGVLIGYAWIRNVSATGFRPIIGSIVLVLTALHLARQTFPGPFERVPHRLWFAWFMGMAAGATTMMANAAGPVVTLFFLAIGLSKLEFVGTAALFFLAVNLFKVPFSVQLGFITPDSLRFNLMLAPLVALGIFSGRYFLHGINQRLFERILLTLTGLTALHLIFG